MAKSDAIQKEIQAEKADQKKYALVRTPSPASEQKASTESEEENEKEVKKAEKKKKKKREL